MFARAKLRFRSSRAVSAAALWTMGTAFVLAAAAGCNKGHKPQAPSFKEALRTQSSVELAERQASAPAPSAASAAAVGADATGEPKYSEPNFELSIESAGAPSTGKPAQATIMLVAKSPFHVNQSYPYKFKIKAAEGLKSEKPVWSSEAVKLENQRAVMTVGFTPESAGTKKLAGQFAFSVCTADKCLIEKRELALTLNVL